MQYMIMILTILSALCVCSWIHVRNGQKSANISLTNLPNQPKNRQKEITRHQFNIGFSYLVFNKM